MKQITTVILISIMYLGLVAPFGNVIRGQEIRKTLQTNFSDMEKGLKFNLSEAGTEAEKRETPPPVESEKLSDGETQALLSRLPKIGIDDEDKKEFVKPVRSLPAPKTGAKVPVKFPADEANDERPEVKSGELEIVRYSPAGEVKIAANLSVTFSQPMVSVTTQQESSKTVPVKLTPNVEGKWRWIGTKTLKFDPKTRFPMATRFKASIPAGTRSATGGVLAKAVEWEFETPAPKLISKFPVGSSSRPRDQVMFLGFDQEIDPSQMLEYITVRAGKEIVPVRLATAEEIEANVHSNYTKFAKGRWLAVRAINPDGGTENALPQDSWIDVEVTKGAPSAEGALTTNAKQEFRFRTYGSFKVNQIRCNTYQKVCSPLNSFSITFSNSVDMDSFDESLIQITPKIEGARIVAYGRRVSIEGGAKRSKTKYKIKIKGELKDTYGQILGKDVEQSIKTDSLPTRVFAEGDGYVLLDPSAKTPGFDFYSTNEKRLDLKVYSVKPEDWASYCKHLRSIYRDSKYQTPLPGKLVAKEKIEIETVPDQIVQTRIPLSRWMPGGLGNVIVQIDFNNDNELNVRTPILAWVQSTKIGLDAFVDKEEMVGFATDLATGAPISGVDMSIYPNEDGNDKKQGFVGLKEEPGYAETAWNWIMSFVPTGDGVSVESEGKYVGLERIEKSESGITESNGILRMPLPRYPYKDGRSILLARKGNDVAFLPENGGNYWQTYSNWYQHQGRDTYKWYVFDDRGMYKPKEVVSIKGYVRKFEDRKNGDIARSGLDGETAKFLVEDSRGNEIGKGEVKLNRFGAFDFQFKLPDNANLGWSNVVITTENPKKAGRISTSHGFQIQEFRRPEFEVATKVVSEAPFVIGDSANVEVEAKYFSGGGLANAKAHWLVSPKVTNYTPPNRGDYVFGKWVPWWRDFDDGDSVEDQVFNGTTDENGKHKLKIDFESSNPPRPYNVNVSSSVEDVNRQQWGSSTRLLVHPSNYYVGLKSKKNFVEKGDPIEIGSIVSDIEGKLIEGSSVEIKAELRDWKYKKGKWVEESRDVQYCTITSGKEEKECKFTAKDGGQYKISAIVMDENERFNQTELTVWVAGGQIVPNKQVESQTVELIPSKETFNPGDIAEFLVVSPFSNAEAVLTLRRSGIVSTDRFSIKGNSAVIRVPIKEEYLPNIYVQVDLVGSTPRVDEDGANVANLPNRPAFGSGDLEIEVSKKTRRLAVEAEPRVSTLTPGGETELDVNVKDLSGNPVANTELAIVVVDESILALSNYYLADPVNIFYSDRGKETNDYHSRESLVLSSNSSIGFGEGDGSGTGRGSGSARAYRVAGEGDMSFSTINSSNATSGKVVQLEGMEYVDVQAAVDVEPDPESGPITIRNNFDPLATFAPHVVTDTRGSATVKVKLPDNLTRYRVMAVSVDEDNRFGKGESAITARKPLMVRPSAPRFMNFGDKIELPVVVQNQTETDMNVEVAVRSSNAILTDGGGRKVTVRANDRAEIRFPVSSEKAGTARFQFAATSGKYNDAAAMNLPVLTPATSEAFATYGTTDKDGAIIQPVAVPGNVYPQFGGLELTTSSTQLQELTDSFIYLYQYPFECSEQIASRMLSIAALEDVLSAFKADDMPSKSELKANFAENMKVLQSRQNSNGYFGLWKRDGERWKYPFVTAHVAHALTLAKAKGYDVPNDLLNRVKPYLKNIEKHFDSDFYTAQARWSTSAYALYVRNEMGENDELKAKLLLSEAGMKNMSFESLGWLLSVFADGQDSNKEIDEITRYMMNNSDETASTAQFNTNYGDGEFLIMYSRMRTDAVLLDAFLKIDALKNAGKSQVNVSDFIPKLVRGLLDHRTKGRWLNTQENVFTLLALDDYFRAYEGITPNFVNRVWLGDVYAGEQKFVGRSVDSKQLEIPMKYLVDQGGASNLTVQKKGAGRVYYRIGMKYAPTNLNLKAKNYGFSVSRTYEPIEDASDVSQGADGRWIIKSGAKIRVRINMVAAARRYHVALIDPLPAGFEIMNPDLAVTGVIPGNTGGRGSNQFSFRWGWRGTWFDHQNFRDDRAEAFSSIIRGGVYEYSYVARATTPGEFIAPPAKAEEMYHPETFGRSETDFVTVR